MRVNKYYQNKWVQKQYRRGFPTNFIYQLYAIKKAATIFRSQLLDFEVGPPGLEPGTLPTYVGML
jgi:hypothetical protein